MGSTQLAGGGRAGSTHSAFWLYLSCSSRLSSCKPCFWVSTSCTRWKERGGKKRAQGGRAAGRQGVRSHADGTVRFACCQTAAKPAANQAPPLPTATCRLQRLPRSSWRQLAGAAHLVLALGCQIAVVHLLQLFAALLLSAHNLALALLLRILGIQLLLLVVCRRGSAGGR